MNDEICIGNDCIDNDDLETKLFENSIHIPKSPFLEVLTSLGADEALSGVFNVGGTAIVDGLFPGSSELLKSVTGPVVEKVGFIPIHIINAIKEYKTLPEEIKGNKKDHIMKELKKLGRNLKLDICIHDPLYISMMMYGLNAYPNVPASLISFTSFVLGVFTAAAIETTGIELGYLGNTKILQSKGFEKESYYEARFLIRNSQYYKDLLKSLSDKFELSDIKEREYHDIYYPDIKLPSYNERNPKLRLRNRTSNSENLQTAQIIYTRSNRLSKSSNEQFNYFLQRKDKFYFELNQEMPTCIEEIENNRVRKKLLKSLKSNNTRTIDFERAIVSNDKTLYVATDKILSKRPFYVLEIKVRKDKELLKKAMMHVMYNFPFIQTTYGKLQLSQLNKY